ncbi:hypothetical protein SOCEGT47_042390 [Sorangium cellulosum]|jgi:hypothetical protein|uniref:WbqC-like protein n=1 Tax=Sorangium cellulosum TaxID=56 RepID=A0A4P2Q351_SORCE|nr:WbqC family protein [Sorangium cellulosum]AUX23709.1 hypothetical protein SOCEGT47_042390 [Sorangium cellulosum]
MIISAHQSHFLPWLGYLDKIRRSDVFVVLDHVQFERQNYQNRNRIKTRAGAAWLSVPVRQRSRAELICDKEIENAPDGSITWGERMVRTLDHAYSRAPYYGQYRPFLADVLTRPWHRLVELNDVLLRYFLDQLEISTPIVYSTSLCGLQGARADMMVNLCQILGADTYLAGGGGSRSYIDAEMFEAAGLRVAWQTFEHPVYPQLRPPEAFLPQLAVVDLLFNCGSASASVLRGERAPSPSRPQATRAVHAREEPRADVRAAE